MHRGFEGLRKVKQEDVETHLDSTFYFIEEGLIGRKVVEDESTLGLPTFKRSVGILEGLPCSTQNIYWYRNRGLSTSH